MYRRQNLFIKPLLGLLALTVILNAPVFSAGDISGAWENVSLMIKFIESGDASSTERAGNQAIAAIEKAVDSEKDQGKRDKLTDAKAQVREALSHAGKGEWPYAEGAAKRALKLIEEAR